MENTLANRFQSLRRWLTAPTTPRRMGKTEYAMVSRLPSKEATALRNVPGQHLADGKPLRERRQCLREESADEPLIVKRELLEEIFDVDVELKVPEVTAAGKNGVDAVLLAGEEGLEILVGLRIVHIDERIQARTDVEHGVRGISEGDHTDGAQPERGMTPRRAQHQERGEYGQYQDAGDFNWKEDAQKGKYRKPDYDGCLYGSGPTLEQIGEDQDEDSRHGEQALQMHARAQEEEKDDEDEQAVAIPVFGRAVPAQGNVKRQDGEQHGQRIDFGLGGICPEGRGERRGKRCNRAAGQDGNAVGYTFGSEPPREQTNAAKEKQERCGGPR